MRFEKGDIASFFRSKDRNTPELVERRALIESHPETYTGLRPEGHDLLEETIALAINLDTLPEGFDSAGFAKLEPIKKCHLLGQLWEADYLLMKPDHEGVFRLACGCVCFPSHWDLGEKMGLPMAAIHDAVPGLNDALGRQINAFLSRIKPGISWERGNWGLSRSPESNLHPSIDLPRLDQTVSLDEVWWRLEEQSLVSLPGSGGILFGIKLVIRPLAEIKNDPQGRAGMIRALESMPEEMAAYKGIASARSRLLDLMKSP